MNSFFDTIEKINNVVNEFVGVKVGIFLLLAAGAYLTYIMKGFQITNIKVWMKYTFGALIHPEKNTEDKQAISPFQSVCTALAATVGTGNIAGVGAAIYIGGAGAVFWMWVAAFFGMMSKFAEQVLGIYYRRRNEQGEWNGGAMYYLLDGVGANPKLKGIARLLAFLFAVFTMLAGFGIGNMSQVNKMVLSIKGTFLPNYVGPMVFGMSMYSLLIGICIMIITSLVVLGGLQSIAHFAETMVPFMAIFYIVGSLIVIAGHITNLPGALAAVFMNAFGTRALAGGAAGVMMKTVITQGCKRGLFSNEAGLGSSVMAHSASTNTEPFVQGMWGIFEVFCDTFIICTMTAMVILVSGYVDLDTGMVVGGVTDATIVAESFKTVLGQGGGIFATIATFLFAFTTLVAWCQYGTKATEYAFGTKASGIYKYIFIFMILQGSVMTSSLAWDISDTFNGLMMIPNLIGVLYLSPLIVRISKNYMQRKNGEDVEPLVSYQKG